MTAIVWKNGVDGAFSDAADWAGGIVPGTGDDAGLLASGVYTVTVRGDAVLNSLSTASACSCGTG